MNWVGDVVAACRLGTKIQARSAKLKRAWEVRGMIRNFGLGVFVLRFCQFTVSGE